MTRADGGVAVATNITRHSALSQQIARVPGRLHRARPLTLDGVWNPRDNPSVDHGSRCYSFRANLASFSRYVASYCTKNDHILANNPFLLAPVCDLYLHYNRAKRLKHSRYGTHGAMQSN
jgi:hypothetical protein